VPKNAGIDTEEGFDLSTMHTLMRHMGMPHLAAPAVHIAVGALVCRVEQGGSTSTSTLSPCFSEDGKDCLR